MNMNDTISYFNEMLKNAKSDEMRIELLKSLLICSMTFKNIRNELKMEMGEMTKCN